MSQLARKTQIAAKVEASEGVAESLAAGDAVLVYDPNPRPDIGWNERRPTRESLDPVLGVPGRRGFALDFGMDYRGSGSVSTPPDYDVPLRGAGHQRAALSSITIGAVTSGPFWPTETITGGTSNATGRVVGRVANGTTTLRFVALSGTFQNGETITGGSSGATATTGSAVSSAQGYEYRPLSTDPPSLTLGAYEDGTRYLAAGCRGTLKIDLNTASIGRLGFSFRGAYQAHADVSMLSGVSYQTVVPPAILGVTLSLHEQAPKFSTFGFDQGGETADLDDASSSGGFASVKITGRAPVIALDPLAQLVATHDWMAKVLAGTAGIFHAEVGTGTAKRMMLAAPNVQYRNPGRGERAGVLTRPIQVVCSAKDENALDDGYQIAMY